MATGEALMFDWLSMGDYTFYVWTSVGIVSIMLGVKAWRAHTHFISLKAKLAWSKHAES